MFTLATPLWSHLRVAGWLHAGRARAYLMILGVILGGSTAAYLALSSAMHDPFGKALGTDFANFWTASLLTLGGQPAAPWDVAAHASAQAALFGDEAGYAAFFYPPPYLLVCLPLALLPYAGSLALWLGTTGLAWALMVRRWLGTGAGWLPILAFPAALVNAGHGQNGFLTAALLGSAALIASRRPVIAGMLFGCLIVKPHLGLLIPLFLLVSGNARAFLAAALSAACLCLASWLVLGTTAWQGFVATAALARSALEQDLVGYAKMQSIYAGIRLIGGGNATAWAVQACAALAACLALWVTRAASERARGAALACATPLATPFLLDYDLTLLAVPLAFLFRSAARDAFLPWEKIVLLAGFVLPLTARGLAGGLGSPIAPFVILALLLCIVRRAEGMPAQIQPSIPSSSAIIPSIIPSPICQKAGSLASSPNGSSSSP